MMSFWEANGFFGERLDLVNNVDGAFPVVAFGFEVILCVRRAWAKYPRWNSSVFIFSS